MHTAVIALALALLVAGPARAFDTAAREAILLDYGTGSVLFEKNADEPTQPSSMTKMMTVYLAFQALGDGSLSMEDELAVSERAWRMGGSKMYVEVGTRVKVADLLRGIIVQSGNDATVVIAEGLAGSEEAFAERMTAKAAELGMANTTFLNASGWPQEGHVTTVRDLATLAAATIRDFPDLYPLYAETSFEYNGIKQDNRNPLLYKSVGGDGLKTGHTEAAGYGLASSAIRNGRRLVLVVNGLSSVQERAQEAERMLDWGFRETRNYELLAAGATALDAAVWLGESDTVPLVVEAPVVVTLAQEARRRMTVKVVYDGPIPAPIAKGAVLGRLVVAAPGVPTVERDLVAGADVGELSPLRRIVAAAAYLIWGSGGG
jgi:D-alanyl-D-alanine carboxypeptidase (penicillin-binding protein 5/6)